MTTPLTAPGPPSQPTAQDAISSCPFHFDLYLFVAAPTLVILPTALCCLCISRLACCLMYIIGTSFVKPQFRLAILT